MSYLRTLIFAPSSAAHCAPLIRNVEPSLMTPCNGRLFHAFPPVEYWMESPLRLMSLPDRLASSTKLCEQKPTECSLLPIPPQYTSFIYSLGSMEFDILPSAGLFNTAAILSIFSVYKFPSLSTFKLNSEPSDDLIMPIDSFSKVYVVSLILTPLICCSAICFLIFIIQY